MSKELNKEELNNANGGLPPISGRKQTTYYYYIITWLDFKNMKPGNVQSKDYTDQTACNADMKNKMEEIKNAGGSMVMGDVYSITRND